MWHAVPVHETSGSGYFVFNARSDAHRFEVFGREG
jgi:hypothetical protein